MKASEPISRVAVIVAVVVGVSGVTNALWPVRLLRSAAGATGSALVDIVGQAYFGQAALVVLAAVSGTAILGGLVLILHERSWSRMPGRRGSAPAAVVVATSLIIVGIGGGATAAGKIGSAQIKNNSVRSSDIRNGTLQLKDLSVSAAALIGAAAAPRTVAVAGPSTGLFPHGNSEYLFAGPTVEVTVDAVHPRVTGSVTGIFSLVGGSAAQYAVVGLCLQTAQAAALVNLAGAAVVSPRFTVDRAAYTATASAAPGAGTYRFGLCIRNDAGASNISAIGNVNGWAQVSR